MADFITFDDAKKLLEVSDKDLHSYIAQGKLSPVRDGGAVQFRNSEIEALQADLSSGVQLSMGTDDGIVLDFGTDVSELGNDDVAEEIVEELIEEVVELDDEIIEEEILLEEPPLTADETEEIITLEEAPEVAIVEEEIFLEEDDDEGETIILSDDDDEESETIILSDDDGDDTILLADDGGDDTISLVDDDATQSDYTVAMSEEDMVIDDDGMAVELAGGAQLTALPEGAYIAQDMPPSLLVTIPLILGFVLLLFGGMILYPMVGNASPEGGPFVPTYLAGLTDMVLNW